MCEVCKQVLIKLLDKGLVSEGNVATCIREVRKEQPELEAREAARQKAKEPQVILIPLRHKQAKEILFGGDDSLTNMGLDNFIPKTPKAKYDS